MQVFILSQECGYEGVFLQGVFSSEEKAQKARDKTIDRWMATPGNSFSRERLLEDMKIHIEIVDDPRDLGEATDA